MPLQSPVLFLNPNSISSNQTKNKKVAFEKITQARTHHPMAKTSKNPSWLTAIQELIELFLKNFNKRPRTWHQHVVPYEDDWAVRREGNKRVTSKHRKQSTAIKKAKTIAKRYKADVIIHRADGTIRDRINFD
ncbi:MAG: hypothetical protein ACI828_002347 [Flavobacteriales bacterium]|jgi:hypothetical protein